MRNLGALFKQEISRLCRQIRRAIETVKKASAADRHDIAAALKRQVQALSWRKVRSSLRKRLAPSAKQLALLLGVSEQSVYNWETKKATPRKDQLAAIIGTRDIGKREAQQRLDAI